MLKNQPTFYVSYLGCKVNLAELDSYSLRLSAAGWGSSPCSVAELIIINTCTVTSVADKKTRQTVRKVCKENSRDNTRIIVTGCASEIDPNVYKEMDSRIQIIKKSDMDKFISEICDDEDTNENILGNIYVDEDFRSRATIKVQDGCNNSCTYCIVHTARGRSVSLPHEDIEKKVCGMLNAGVKELIFSGIDIGAYNDNGFVLEDLCESLLTFLDKHNARIRISSIEPQNVTDRLIDTIAGAEGKICRHLHMPIQSGSSKVLKEMNRHYNAEEYFETVSKLKKKIPQIALSTDVIVGFPGEDEKDFNDTYSMLKNCEFMRLHVFPYSKREGTPAAVRSDQVPQDIKAKRAAMLRDLSAELMQTDLDKRHGTEEFVLIENQKCGRSESYHLINLEKDYSVGSLVKMKL